jgi:formamidopyrimidine-DNA glycosylase
VRAIDRRAKYLLFRLDDGNTLIAHLGMSGPHDAARRRERRRAPVRPARPCRLGNRRGLAGPLQRRPPLRPDAAGGRHGPAQAQALQGTGPGAAGRRFDGIAPGGAPERTPHSHKGRLLDQKTLVGVGNIYACEALFLAGISPRRSSHTVQGERADRLVAAIKKVLQRRSTTAARPCATMSSPAASSAISRPGSMSTTAPASSARRATAASSVQRCAVRPLDLLLRALPRS